MTNEQILANLKKFRMQQNYAAPFKVFPDSALNLLMEYKPTTIQALTGIKGFPGGGVRVEKYGEAICKFFRDGCKVGKMDAF